MATRISLCEHASERMAEMGVDINEVGMALSEPELTYPGSVKYKPGRTCYQRGRIVVVWCNVEQVVVTVLWHQKEGRS
jgi:hypothetical protein